MNLDAFLKELDSTLAAELSARALPGVALACIEDGTTAAVRVQGLAHPALGKPVAPDTLFRLASISKSVAAWAVMVLVERGLVALDDPIGSHLRQWTLPAGAHDPSGVTLRRLLSHQAGISVPGIGRRPHDGRRSDVVEGLAGRNLVTNPEQDRYFRRWNLPPDAPVFLANTPGAGYAYSNGGFAMLEAMIEDVSGEPYEAFVTREVLAPLGMHRSAFDPLPEALAQTCAQPHFENGDPVEDWVPQSRAAGGLWSSITDLATFAAAALPGPNDQAPGRGVVSPASIHAMQTSHGFSGVQEGVAFDVGLGHFLHTDAGGTVHVSHTGGFSGWRSVYWILPKARAGLCVLIHSDGGNDLWVNILRRWIGLRGTA